MNWASKLATNQSPEDAEAPNTNHKKQRKLRTDKVLNYDNVSLSTNKLQLRNITFINFTNQKKTIKINSPTLKNLKADIFNLNTNPLKKTTESELNFKQKPLKNKNKFRLKNSQKQLLRQSNNDHSQFKNSVNQNYNTAKELVKAESPVIKKQQFQLDLLYFQESLRTTAASTNKKSSKHFTPFPYRRVAPSQVKQINIAKQDFEIGKYLGKGQYGQVNMVRHKKTGFFCAMKVMSKKEIKQQDYVNQIIRQITIHSYINHRNIAPLYGYFQDQDNLYLLVQYCQGGQLYDKIKKERRLQQKNTSMIVKEILQGLNYLHRLQIIHRDLKPENILFNNGVVKISDFGWAVFHNEGFRKTVSGSPLYYPPEIVKGQSYDEKIDLWNVGMMTYQCLLGKIPFRIYSELDLNKIIYDQVKFPDYVDVSPIAKDFILKIMRKNPQQRMQIRQMLRHKFITQYETTHFLGQLEQEFNKFF